MSNKPHSMAPFEDPDLVRFDREYGDVVPKETSLLLHHLFDRPSEETAITKTAKAVRGWKRFLSGRANQMSRDV